MGGEKEFTTPAKKSDKKSGKGTEETIGQLRIHENKGEIHFHDDAKKLKCAVPVADWYAAWQYLWKNIGNTWNYADIKNKTTVMVELHCTDSESGGTTKLDLEMYVVATEVGDELASMIKFMEE